MTGAENFDPRDGNAHAEDAQIENIAEVSREWSPLTAAVPSSARPLLVISSIATLFGGAVFLAVRFIDGLALNLGYIVAAVFGFYVVSVLQTLFESWWRRRASEREIENVYKLRYAIITAFLEKNETLTTEAVQALIELANGEKIETQLKKSSWFG